MHLILMGYTLINDIVVLLSVFPFVLQCLDFSSMLTYLIATLLLFYRLGLMGFYFQCLVAVELVLT